MNKQVEYMINISCQITFLKAYLQTLLSMFIRISLVKYCYTTSMLRLSILSELWLRWYCRKTCNTLEIILIIKAKMERVDNRKCRGSKRMNNKYRMQEIRRRFIFASLCKNLTLLRTYLI